MNKTVRVKEVEREIIPLAELREEKKKVTES